MFRLRYQVLPAKFFFFLVSRSDIALDFYAGSGKPLARLAPESHGGTYFVQRHQGHLVSTPQSPECRRSQTTTPRVTHNCQVVDVDPIVERINPIANLPCVLAIDLDAGVILGPGESETAATGFLPLRHQTDTRCTLHQDFGLALMKGSPQNSEKIVR